MRRQSVKRVIAEQPKGHIHYNPRHGSVPRKTNTDEDQEVVEMGSRETGMGSETNNQSSENRNTGFPSSSKSDRSVKTHGHNNPKVDSRPVETSNEKGSSTSQRQLEGAKGPQSSTRDWDWFIYVPNNHSRECPKFSWINNQCECPPGYLEDMFEKMQQWEEGGMKGPDPRGIIGSKREAGIIWVENPKMPDGGYWAHDPSQKTDPNFKQEKAVTIEPHPGLEGIREHESEFPGYVKKDTPLEYSDLLNRLQGGEDIPLKQEALHLCIDERLRGNVNSIVESFDDLNWDDIDSVSYQPMAAAESIEDWPTTSKDGIMIYHADTPSRQAQGLQYVEENDFPKNAVMLFKNASGPFHMHNCRFPIDIIFTDDDFRVLAIHNMIPEGGYTYSPMGTKHAVETHPDWAENKGISEGDILFKDE